MQTTVTKADIARKICAHADIRQQDAKKWIDQLLVIIKKALKEEHEVLFSGFGKFETFTRKTRQGRNPHTKEVITLHAHEVVAFRLSRTFKAELLQNNQEQSQDEKNP